MRVTVFAKKRKTKDGRPFTGYIGVLTNKNGEEVNVGISFREECGSPKAEVCPCYIDVPKTSANLNRKTVEIPNEDGEIVEVERRTLWVSEWTMAPEKYVDHSLDEFDD